MTGNRRCIGFVCASLLLNGAAYARVDMTPATVPLTLTWSGGDVLASASFCVLSTQEPNPSGTTPTSYNIRGLAPFSLASGANVIPYALSWQDLYVPARAPVALTAGVQTSSGFTGAVAGCPLGNNGRLNLLIAQSAVAAAPPGVYSGALQLEAITIDSQGRKVKLSTVNISLTLPWAIRVSQLNDIDLGTFTGITDLVGSDALCVYRNSNAPYGVRVSGQGVAGAYVAANGASQVPLQVTWNDGSGAVALLPGGLLSNRGNVYTAGLDCAGGAANNAVLAVTATVAGMSAVNPGQYTGVLTVTVETQ